MGKLAIRLVAVASLVTAPLVPSAGAQEAAPTGKIAFASNVDGDYEIFVMNADGSNVRQLTFNDADDFEPAWSPTGRRIVFERERKDGYEDLFMVGVRSGTVRRWIVTPGVDEGDAAWSPNGRWIAFRGNDWEDGADVLALTPDRERSRMIAAQQENSTNSHPAWSPDGKHVALLDSYDGSILFVRPFGARDEQRDRDLADSGSWMYDVDWSPDGTCIAYTQDASNSSRIYTVPAEGGEPRLVHTAPTYGEVGSWSPDGSRILFHAHSGTSYDLYTTSTDGTDVVPLTETPDVDEINAAWWGEAPEPATPECGAEPAPSALPKVPAS